MTVKWDLPEHVIRFIEGSVVSEFATVSQAGVPIDTPTYYFPSDDMTNIAVATGQSYPAKAERARRNPKVGLLIEGKIDEPVVTIRGRAAVRDSDLQANAVRYISETGFSRIAFGLDWSEARKAVWYWTRIIIEIMPARILWWDNPAAMDRPPHVWNAPVDTVFPQSDPKPSGQASPPAKWGERPWEEIAAGALARNAGAHLTLMDDDGYPIPIRARSFELIDNRFKLTMPSGVSWSGRGMGTLTFEGIETFVGEVSVDGSTSWLTVERALPEHPLMKNPLEVLQPSDVIREKLMSRLVTELSRRGQQVPDIPEELPTPTRLARVREDRISRSA